MKFKYVFVNTNTYLNFPVIISIIQMELIKIYHRLSITRFYLILHNVIPSKPRYRIQIINISKIHSIQLVIMQYEHSCEGISNIFHYETSREANSYISVMEIHFNKFLNNLNSFFQYNKQVIADRLSLLYASETVINIFLSLFQNTAYE